MDPVLLRSNEPADPASFDDVDAIVVGGGPTPEYLAGLLDSAPRIQAAVQAGTGPGGPGCGGG
ncbi:hypothetical protein [Arthrobacter sp. B3I4]|uniref:hypothetical protein n=1 Tax=Arthrobacter sp. B3I4 TaxID=3042267 RepID=UPI00277DA594|nr:hypothetical protein [Arthrobacter sp. B3I4]MDQ0755396.1 cobyrinic acid a,c-diamide synthase [Arthrobacter sp. B3I4]